MNIWLSFAEAMEKFRIPLVTLTVNGREGNFVVDTGASNSHIDIEFAKETTAEVIPFTEGVATSLLGDSVVSHCYKLTLNLGEICLTDVIFSETDFKQVNESLKESGVNIQGLIGMDIMRMLHGYIDLDNLTLTFRLPEIE